MIKLLMTGGALLISNAALAHEAAMLDGISHALAHSGGTSVLLITSAIMAAAGLVFIRNLRRAKSRSHRE